MSDTTSNPGDQPAEPRSAPPETAGTPPRLWPAVLILAVQWAAKVLTERFWPGEPAVVYAVFYGPLLSAVLVLVWWLFASRVSWRDRLLMLVVVLAGAAVILFTGTTGPQVGGFKLVLYALQMALTAGTLWLLVTPLLRWPWRRLGLVAALLLPMGYYSLVRLDGVTGEFTATLSWAWSESGEDRSMAEINKRQEPTPVAAPTKLLELEPGDWPGFRGPERDGTLRGVRLAADWVKHPPRLLWKQRVGPG